MNRNFSYVFFSLFGFMLLWELLARAVAGLQIGLYIPTTSAVLSELVNIFVSGQTPVGQSSYYHIIQTLRRLVSGVFLGSVVGLAVGVVMGLREKAEDFFESWNWIFATIPAVMWAYILILVLGANEVTAIGVLAAVTYPQMAFRVSRGIRAVKPELVEMGKAFNARTFLLLREVYLPQILPSIFSGVRYSLALGIKIIAIAELVGLSSGIGFIMQYWWDQRLVAPLLAWGAILMMLGFVFEFGFFRTLERRLFRWTGQG